MKNLIGSFNCKVLSIMIYPIFVTLQCLCTLHLISKDQIKLQYLTEVSTPLTFL